MPFFFDDIDHIVHMLLTGLKASRLDHDADQLLCTGFPHQDPAFLSKLCSNLSDGRLHIGIVLCLGLTLYTHILEHLGIDPDRRSQSAERFLPGHHNFHHLETGQDSVAGRRVLGKDDVAGLLSADAVSVPNHILIDIFVADIGLLVVDPGLVESLIEAEVGHNCM